MRETWWRDEFSTFYNLEDNDWDEGWGWAKYNDPEPHLFEFGKMMGSGMLLYAGIGSPTWQGEWGKFTTTDRSGGANAVARTEDIIDVVFRSAAGALMHYAPSGNPDTGEPWA